jgi:DNA-directed RNA polymerase subunit F
MTKEEIIEMARQAGVRDDEHIFEFSQYKYLEAFAKLVAEKEREACANICETLELPEWPDKVRQPLAQAIRARGKA